MPSFDVVSEVELSEVRNAVDQASREVGTRFDFKGVDASYELQEADITLAAESDFQIQQMMDILKSKLIRRNVDVMSLQEGEVQQSGKKATLKVSIQQGIDADTNRKLVRLIKDAKHKVQTAIQGDKLRVSGKKRDDLQAVIAMLRDTKLDIPLQFNNFRD